jgi:outer membrane protein OmpA-like peptidoglycan-associated protein
MQETHMANSMLESILDMFTPDMQQNLASRLGEPTTGVQSGVGAATATTLNGLADRAGDSGFLGQITGLLGGGVGQSSAPVSETTWFDFDRLLFDTGKATLQPASQEQLTNSAAILKAYPQVEVRIGGYTDNTGDPAANLQLSQQRADNVMGEISRLGVDPSRMSAKGYGEENPVADNSTEEGRQKNRRISLRVTGKLGSTA